MMEMLECYSDPLDKGRLLDAFARCVVAFRAAPEFAGAQLLVGNSNKGLRPVQNARCDFLDTLVNNSCGNGTSDVSYTVRDDLYLSSSKYFERVRSIDDYDISGLIQLWDSLYRTQYRDLCVVLFVRDRDEFLKMAQRANKSHLNKVTHVFGIAEMERMVSVIRDALRTQDLEDYMRVMTSTQRTPLNLLFHQRLMLSMTLACQDDRTRLGLRPLWIIWGALPRSGKSYLTAGHILRSIERGMRSFLLVTPIPNETIHQFKDDLFDRLAEFADVDMVVGNEITEHVKAYQEATAAGKPTRPFVAMMSKQLDHAASRNDPGKLGVACGFSFDTIYYDEGHCGGSTELSLQMFESYTDPSRTQIIMMTATYHKPHTVLGVPAENIILWDLDGLEAARKGNMEGLRKIYGTHVDATGTTPEELRATYSKEPRMCLMSAYHKPSFVERFRAIHGERTSCLGADLNRIFDLNKEDKFSNQEAVRQTVGILLGSGIDTDDRLCVMDNIRAHANEKGGRGGSHGLSQMWFLPYGQGRQIEHVSRELKELLEAHPEGRKYHVVSLNEHTGDLRAFIANEEAISRGLEKKGTIILTGKRASMGISLPRVDIVVLLTHTSSADDVYQKMWRCMTRDVGKSYGYVIDMDAHRVLNTLLIYDANSRSASERTIRDRITRLSKIVDLADILCMDMSHKDIVQELHSIWQEDMYARRGTFERRLREMGLVFDEETGRKMRALLGYSTASKDTLDNRALKTNDTDRRLPESASGTRPISEDDKDADDDSLASELEALSLEEEEPYDISDILPSIVNLGTALTFRKVGPKWADIRGTIQGIYDDPCMCSAFEEQCSIYWRIPNIQQFKRIVMEALEKMNPIVDQGIKEFIEFNRGFMVMLSLNKKRELIEHLQSILKPKEVEKKTLGEVFTPLPLVEQMLDQLPIDVWTEPSLKWFDPAVGVGNFMVCIYYRLMDSLAGLIEDEADRSRHIITEMLYMSELNQKNVHMCRLIFGEEANIHQGDTLQLDITGKWGVEGFDVVVGNPPYNTEQKSTGSSPLYHRFVEMFIDRTDYMMYIIPSRWFSGGKGLGDFRTHMLSRDDIAIIKHFPDASSLFGRNVQIKGGVCYFLKDSDHSGKCMFNGVPITLGAYDILVEDKYHTLVEKLTKNRSIADLFRSQTYYNINTNDARLCNNASLVKCYVSKQKGGIKYIDSKHISVPTDTFKVITTEASTANYDCFGNTFLGRPGEVHSKSYISFEVKNQEEGESLLSYLCLRLPNLMLKLRKNSQHISTALKWIPLPPLDQIWTDDRVYEYFELTPEEISIIENTPIVGYKK